MHTRTAVFLGLLVMFYDHVHDVMWLRGYFVLPPRCYLFRSSQSCMLKEKRW